MLNSHPNMKFREKNHSGYLKITREFKVMNLLSEYHRPDNFSEYYTNRLKSSPYQVFSN